MKTEQKPSARCATKRQAFAWIACFAILFAGLAMPMTPTLPRSEGERVLSSDLCRGNGTQTLVRLDSGVPDRGHEPGGIVQQCGCCGSGMTVTALPIAPDFTHVALIQPSRFPISIVRIASWPRVNGPAVNPRAWPRV